MCVLVDFIFSLPLVLEILKCECADNVIDESNTEGQKINKLNITPPLCSTRLLAP